MTITLNDMRDKLLTLDEVYEKLGKTEPFSLDNLVPESKVRFRLGDNWAEEYVKGGEEAIDASVEINGVEKSLSSNALADFGRHFKFPMTYAMTVPTSLTERLLNYHYSVGLEDADLRVFAVGGTVQSVGKSTLESFSNLAILDGVIDAVREKYGSNVEILADYKFQNSLPATDIRLIVPEAAHVMRDTNMPDVPMGGSDEWSMGIHIANSITGSRQTSVEPYLFRWWCTNGATQSYDQAGRWNRKANGQHIEDVVAWAERVVEESFEGMRDSFERVQRLNAIKLRDGNTADVLREIYTQFKVPIAQQSAISEALLEAPELNMYTLQNAITQSANDPELSPDRQDKLMRIGGEVINMSFDTTKARVFREGQQAGSNAENPYELASE